MTAPRTAGRIAFTSVSELFSSWKLWSDERGFKPGSGTTLSDAIADKGFTRKKGAKGVRGFVGLVTKVPGA